MIFKYRHLNLGYSIVFEDDGRVAYAYLLNNNDEIVGDVWLYNIVEAPLNPEWKTDSELPYVNSIEFAANSDDFIQVKEESDLRVEWKISNGLFVHVNLYINNQLHAVLKDGSKPGWSSMAKKDGPLAKVLDEQFKLEVLQKDKINQLSGKRLTIDEVLLLKQELPSNVLVDWLVNILKAVPLVGSSFVISEEDDESNIGVDMKWLLADQMIDEALYVYPGKSVVGNGYLPIGSCLEGSGDPYFLKVRESLTNSPIVRIPHDYANHDTYPEESIELVADSLDSFLFKAQIT